MHAVHLKKSSHENEGLHYFTCYNQVSKLYLSDFTIHGFFFMTSVNQFTDFNDLLTWATKMSLREISFQIISLHDNVHGLMKQKIYP